MALLLDKERHFSGSCPSESATWHAQAKTTVFVSLVLHLCVPWGKDEEECWQDQVSVRVLKRQQTSQRLFEYVTQREIVSLSVTLNELHWANPHLSLSCFLNDTHTHTHSHQLSINLHFQHSSSLPPSTLFNSQLLKSLKWKTSHIIPFPLVFSPLSPSSVITILLS